MNVASIGHDVIRVVRVEFNLLKTDNRIAWWKSFTLRGLILLSPAKLIQTCSATIGRYVASLVGGAVARMQTHVIVFRSLREQVLREGVHASREDAINVISKLTKLESVLLESIPLYARLASNLREINQNSKVSIEFDRMVTATEDLYRLVVDVHHVFLGAEKSLGRTWEAAVIASRQNFQDVTASIANDDTESDPELSELAEQALSASEQNGRTHDPKWAKSLARSPLH